MKQDAVRMVSASGILGYGFPESSLKAGLEPDDPYEMFPIEYENV